MTDQLNRSVHRAGLMDRESILLSVNFLSPSDPSGAVATGDRCSERARKNTPVDRPRFPSSRPGRASRRPSPASLGQAPAPSCLENLVFETLPGSLPPVAAAGSSVMKSNMRPG